jgi:hypothetical protein
VGSLKVNKRAETRHSGPYTDTLTRTTKINNDIKIALSRAAAVTSFELVAL